MVEKVGRNDPCPCGSGKKYKQCCWLKDTAPQPKKKFTAKVISSGAKKDEPMQAAMQAEVNLMERTFGKAIEKAHEEGKPSIVPQHEKHHDEKNS